MSAPTIIIAQTPFVGVKSRAAAAGAVAVIEMGVEGRPGRDGADGQGGGGAAAQQVFVQPDAPTADGPFIWIQTGLAPAGAGFTFWFEDGL